MTVKEKKQVTLNLTDSEFEILEDLAQKKDMSKTAVLKHALRLYQMIEDRTSQGEKLYLENDTTKEKTQIMVL